jgi:hypothetical protein
MDEIESESRTDDPVSASRSAKPPIGSTKTVATQDGRNLTYLKVGDPHGPLVAHGHLRQLLTLIPFDCATSAASRVEATEHLVTTGQPIAFLVDALGGFLALHFEPGFRLMYATLGLTAEHFRETFVKQLRKAVNDYDRQILLQLDFETAFCEACAECFAQGSDGLVRDAELLYRSWAFDVRTIERRVHMWQGMDDRLIPAPINKTVADRMPGAVWHPVEGAGHFVAIGSGDELFRNRGRGTGVNVPEIETRPNVISWFEDPDGNEMRCTKC